MRSRGASTFSTLPLGGSKNSSASAVHLVAPIASAREFFGEGLYLARRGITPPRNLSSRCRTNANFDPPSREGLRFFSGKRPLSERVCAFAGHDRILLTWNRCSSTDFHPIALWVRGPTGFTFFYILIEYPPLRSQCVPTASTQCIHANRASHTTIVPLRHNLWALNTGFKVNSA